ncbi:MAG: hypothetical protein M4579_006163 [Chaenotheca gracillima]|nr:MAG: hypothetical protein M4579_006163 [Chaenotheca gracillima]
MSSHSRLPRILCLHGSGSNAEIFKCQTRLIRHQLRGSFEFVFVDGPFLSDPGPGILPTFAEDGPFFQWAAKHSGQDETRAVQHVLGNVAQQPGSERFVGLLGFSQGTRVVAGVLRAQQRGALKLGGRRPVQFRFGVLCMGGGRACFPMELVSPTAPAAKVVDREDALIQMPTLHVHGLTDPIYPKSKELVVQFFAPQSATVLEVDAGHHLPRRTQDVACVCRQILELYLRSQPPSSGFTSQPQASPETLDSAMIRRAATPHMRSLSRFSTDTIAYSNLRNAFPRQDANATTSVRSLAELT